MLVYSCFPFNLEHIHQVFQQPCCGVLSVSTIWYPKSQTSLKHGHAILGIMAKSIWQALVMRVVAGLQSPLLEEFIVQ